MAQITYCRRHKDVETNVSCGRCDDPICPSCMVHAPVGVRCLDCARARPLPTFDVSAPFLLRAIGAGVAVSLLGAAVVIGVIWFIPRAVYPGHTYRRARIWNWRGYQPGHEPKARNAPETGIWPVYVGRLHSNHMDDRRVYPRSNQSDRRSRRVLSVVHEVLNINSCLESGQGLSIINQLRPFDKLPSTSSGRTTEAVSGNNRKTLRKRETIHDGRPRSEDNRDTQA